MAPRSTAEEYYKRFWVRAIRYLAQARRQARAIAGRSCSTASRLAWAIT